MPLVSPGFYPFSPVELQKDLVRLRRFYTQSGFPRPEIAYDVTLDADRNQVRVVFLILEGPSVTRGIVTAVDESGADPERVLPPEMGPTMASSSERPVAWPRGSLGRLRADPDSEPGGCVATRSWLPVRERRIESQGRQRGRGTGGRGAVGSDLQSRAYRFREGRGETGLWEIGSFAGSSDSLGGIDSLRVGWRKGSGNSSAWTW